MFVSIFLFKVFRHTYCASFKLNTFSSSRKILHIDTATALNVWFILYLMIIYSFYPAMSTNIVHPTQPQSGGHFVPSADSNFAPEEQGAADEAIRE